MVRRRVASLQMVHGDLDVKIQIHMYPVHAMCMLLTILILRTFVHCCSRGAVVRLSASGSRAYQNSKSPVLTTRRRQIRALACLKSHPSGLQANHPTNTTTKPHTRHPNHQPSAIQIIPTSQAFMR